ncbi:Mobilization protein [Bacillus thuringiensis]|uniref:Mobilization protein A n=1 Tax=Bacillus thuringiensis TaxID=1428 RepID=A0A9W3SJV9_BACTU|nr:MobQ family relaxase [Bacillus thuringiensis]ANS52467.1 mobilization protein A [Bacillus thuringiensis]MBH0340504.1 Mobilization protein [Bacillus thuringiensis]
MAIYHLKVKTISRKKQQNVVASAAYRSGESLYCERTKETKYYSRTVQPETHILAPSEAPSWVFLRQDLWNEVERFEKRGNSRLAREVVVAIPNELSEEQQRELVLTFTHDTFVQQGMIADVAIHRDDKNNPHAHILLTTREISQDRFVKKKNRDWDKKENLLAWREAWAKYANLSLEKENVQERIDHRSYEKRGIELLPTKHVGYKEHQLEKRGIRTETGEYNRRVQAYNQHLISLQEKRQSVVKEQQKKETDSISKVEISVKGYVALHKKIELVTKQQERLQDSKSKQKLHSYTWLKEQIETSAYRQLEEKNLHVYIQEQSMELQGEYSVRMYEKMKELQTEDMVSLVEAVERDMVMEKVESHLKQSVTYERLQSHIVLLDRWEKSMQKQQNDGRISDTRFVSNMNILEAQREDTNQAIQWYELQAMSYLSRQGYSVYLHDWKEEKHPEIAIQLLEEMKQSPSLSMGMIVQRVKENEVLSEAQKIIRKKVTIDAIDKRRKQLHKWKVAEQKQKRSERVEHIIEQAKVLVKARKILVERCEQELKQYPKTQRVIQSLGMTENSPVMSKWLSWKQETGRDVTEEESMSYVTKLSLQQKEEKILQEAKQVLRKEVTYHNVSVAIDQLQEQLTNTPIKIILDEARTKRMAYELAIERAGEYQKLSSKWRKTSSHQYQLEKLKTWLTQKGIDVNNLAYSLQRMKWNVGKIEKEALRKERIAEVQLPLIQQAKKVLEEQAIRYVGETYPELKDLYTHRHLLSQKERQVLVQMKLWNEESGTVYDFVNRQGNLEDLQDKIIRKKLHVKQSISHVSAVVQKFAKVHQAEQVLAQAEEEKKELETKGNTFKRVVLRDQTLLKEYQAVQERIEKAKEVLQLKQELVKENGEARQAELEELKLSYHQFQEKENRLDGLLEVSDILERTRQKMQQEAKEREYEHQQEIRRQKMKHRGLEL